MTGVIGIDPSLRSTGIAMPDGRLMTVRPAMPDRAAALDYIEGLIAYALSMSEPDLVVYEGPNPHGPGWEATSALAQVRGVMLACLYRHSIAPERRIEVAPARLKRWATGHGNADKDAMIAAARQLGHDPHNDDEADAALLRALGLHGTTGDDPFPTKDAGHRLDVISNMTWPVVTR